MFKVAELARTLRCNGRDEGRLESVDHLSSLSLMLKWEDLFLSGVVMKPGLSNEVRPVPRGTTRVIFIRHAESDHFVKNDWLRPLTSGGVASASGLVQRFAGHEINAVYSSPYHRAIETVDPLAKSRGLMVIADERFRERGVSSEWVEDFGDFASKQWNDFSYCLPGGESLAEVQARNIAALKEILDKNVGQTIAIGTHGCALSTVLRYFDSSFGYEDYLRIAPILPYVVQMEFFDGKLAGVKEML